MSAWARCWSRETPTARSWTASAGWRPSLGAMLAVARRREALEAEVVHTRALRQSDTVKTALLRSISHDLRSPLTAIVAAADALEPGELGGRDRPGVASSEPAWWTTCWTCRGWRPVSPSPSGAGVRWTRSSRPRSACFRRTRRWTWRSSPTCRWCRPTRHSWSGCSPTCWRTRACTARGQPIALRARRAGPPDPGAGVRPRPGHPDGCAGAGVRALRPREASAAGGCGPGPGNRTRVHRGQRRPAVGRVAARPGRVLRL